MSSALFPESRLLSESRRMLTSIPLARGLVATTELSRASEAVRSSFVPFAARSNAIADSSMARQAIRAMEAVRPPIAPSGAIANELAEFSQATLAIRSRIAVLDRMPSARLQAPRTPSGASPVSGLAPVSRSVDLGRIPRVSNPSILDLVSEFIDEDASSDKSSTGSEDEFNLPARFDMRISFRPVAVSAHHLQKTIQVTPYIVITYLERSLRRFVSQRLESVCGPRWFERCVPKDILKRWKSREQEDRHSGSSVYSLIEYKYTNFMDLFFVVTDQGNWESTFARFFRDREETSVSFRRLRRIRNGIAHCRQLNDEHEMTLISEAHWILNRIGGAVLS